MAHIMQKRGTEHLRHGADASVLLCGSFAYKTFYKPLRFEEELSVLQQLPRHKAVVDIMEIRKDTYTLISYLRDIQQISWGRSSLICFRHWR